MTRWLQAAHRATDLGTKPTKPTEPAPRTIEDEANTPAMGVLSVSSVLSEGKRAVHAPAGASVATAPDPELIRDLLEERAAIREYDGGQARAQAKAGALNDVARSTGIAADDLLRFWQSAH